MDKRGSGILLHITSLPSPYGIGDLGPDAYEFVDFLYETHQRYWQILPLTLTSPEYGNSPYSSFSSFAGNILLISPERMLRNGWIDGSDIPQMPNFPENRVDYIKVMEFKSRIFSRAYEKNREVLNNHNDFQRFCEENADWLDDYSLFISIKRHLNGTQWGDWPEELRDRKKEALRKVASQLKEEILKEKFLQYIFFNQWSALKTYCDTKGIKIFGDIPIYVNYDSADVWANPEIFKLDKNKKPAYVAGVPPDYFSTTGQLWGHPVYRWDVLKDTGFEWWIKRIGHNLKLYHMFRLDHFRGFVAFWEVSADEKTAINGRWVDAPAVEFFTKIKEHFPDIPIVAEDLGVITDDVREIMERFGFPGMKVLLFAFGDDLPTNPYAPHNHIRNCVVYTGTHDNNTIKGWYRREIDDATKKRISEYIGRDINERNIHIELIRLAMMSVANTVIFPMQDLLGLGEEDRMNLPASSEGNWEWRLRKEQITSALKKRLRDMTVIYGRHQSSVE